MKTHSTALSTRTILVASALTLGMLSDPSLAARNDAPSPGTYALKDGTTLQVAPNGQMRMFKADGRRLDMKDGVAMQTRDGAVIVMKEDLNWKKIRQFGTLHPKYP